MQISDINGITRYIMDNKIKLSGTILITGVTGFIGRYIVKTIMELNRKGYFDVKIIALVRDENKSNEIIGECNYIEYINWDMSQSLNIVSDIDYVIHTAAIADFNIFDNTPYLCMEKNILGTINIINACKSKKIKKFVYLGAGISYGLRLENSISKIDEDLVGPFQSVDTRLCYAQSKLISEYLVSCAARENKFDFNIVRLFSGYGPGMNLNNKSVFSDIFSKAIKGENIEIIGDGSPIRNLCYITDIITAIFSVLECGEKGKVYNIGSAKDNYTILELANIIREIIQTDSNIIVYGKEEKSFVKKSIQIPDISDIQSIGWDSFVSLKEGITRMRDYYLSK